MSIFVLLLYFYTVMVIEKKRNLAESTKIRHFYLKV